MDLKWQVSFLILYLACVLFDIQLKTLDVFYLAVVWLLLAFLLADWLVHLLGDSDEEEEEEKEGEEKEDEEKGGRKKRSKWRHGV